MIKSKIKIIIRVDAGPKVGSGHVIRCISLAQAAILHGFSVQLIGHVTIGWVRDRIAAEGIPMTFLDGEAPNIESPETLLRQIEGVADTGWVVLDGYRFHLDCQKAVREAGYKLLYIDDYAHLPEYSCDILLNQNIGSEKLLYTGHIDTQLLGERFTLLHPKFLSAREKNLKKVFPQFPQRVLITLGGGDYSSFLPHVAQCIADSPYATCELLVLQGGVSAEAILAVFSAHSLAVRVLSPDTDLASSLLDVDVCVTAAGSTCWELCCLGVPFVVLQIAENQKYVVSNLVDAGMTKIFSTQSLLEFYKSGLDRKIRNTLMQFIDGDGARRVLKAMVQATLQFSIVTQEDCWDIYELANDSEARKYSLVGKAITQAEHERWFSERLKRTAEPFLLAHFQGRSVAYARLEGGENGFVVSIAVAEDFRGLGIGTATLKRAIAEVTSESNKGIYASIHKANHSSQKMFESIGFVKIAPLPAIARGGGEFFFYQYKATC